MKELTMRESISVLVDRELAKSYDKFPAFNSPHEGYAVIKEEVEECKDELEFMENRLQFVWINVRSNISNPQMLIDIKSYAEALAYEAIQVAAMAQKYIDSLGGVKDA